ncbi:MAG: hypothetical protein QCH35_04780 [Methanomicrobiaceae archaeon]|nr:hypothetical protein [Methanomicrobiaceae archaeon]
MGKILRILTVVVFAAVIMTALLLAGIALFMVHMERSAAESAESVYLYELRLSTTEPIENVALLIPVPSRYNPDSGKNETILDISRANLRNFDNVSTSIEYVGGTPMLNISADRIEPLYKNRIEPIAIRPGQNESELPQPTHVYSARSSEATPVLVDMELHMQVTGAGREIDTRMPVCNEPLFAPYRIVESFNGSQGLIEEDYYVSPGSSGSIVEVPLILSYDAADDTVLTISSELQGINQWWVLGWRSNSYHERLRHAFSGACNGTYPVKAVLVTGEGVY